MTEKKQIAFIQSVRPFQWNEFLFGLPPEFKGTSCTLMTNYAFMVPYEYKAGVVYYGEVEDSTLLPEVFDYVWLINGDALTSNNARANILGWAKRYVWEMVREKGYSAEIRILYSDNPEYAPRTVPRLLLVRVFRDSDFKCKGHPELLLGEPIGQYHCPHCMQMEIAGTAHSDLEFPLGRWDIYRASE